MLKLLQNKFTEKFVLFGFGFVSLYYVSSFATKLLSSSKHFLDPAENENMVLINYLKQNLSFSMPDVVTLMQKGIISIYPGFYHQLAYLIPADPLLSGRILSFVSFVVLLLVFGLYLYYKTQNISISTMVPLSVLGSSPDFMYVFVNRVDSLFLSAGLVALVCFSLFNEKKLNRFKIYLFSVGIVFLLVAVLAKQTAAVLVPCCFLLVTFSESKIQWKRAICFILALGILFLAYVLIFDRDFFLRFGIGLFIYGRIFTVSRFFIMVQHYSFNKGYFLLALGVAIFLSIGPGKIHKNYRALLSDSSFWVLILIIIATLKSWGNGAAFFNNFFLLNIGILWYMTGRLSFIEKSRRWIPSAIVVCGTCFSLLYPLPEATVNILGIRQIVTDLDTLPPDSKIASYIRNHPGEYLSSRYDDYIIPAGSTPVVEGSVYISIVHPETFAKFPSVRTAMEILNKNIAAKLNAGQLKGVLLGLQTEEWLTAFPEIAKNYTKVATENINVGVFKDCWNLILYLPNEVASRETF